MVRRIVSGRSHDALAAADTALVASGTATLEAALFQKPMVIAYRLAWLSYRIMRRMGYLPWVGLPNILCRDWVVPEFIQDAARADRMGAALLAQLEDEAGRRAIARRFADLGVQLRQGCAGRAAEVILSMRGRAGA
jgi:lipid-A-disaccharide synthase